MPKKTITLKIGDQVKFKDDPPQYCFIGVTGKRVRVIEDFKSNSKELKELKEELKDPNSFF